jgi:hypothetical protein
MSVTVSPEFAGSTPTGTVAVTRSTITLCVITLSAAKGSCTLSATTFSAADYDIEAVYSGSTDFGSSGSAEVPLTVLRATSRMVLSLSNASVTYGDEQVERMSVTVSPEFAGSTPTGTVTVTRSTTTLCVITLSAAKGSCTLSAATFSPADYDVEAVYAVSTDFGSSGSPEVPLTVSRATTTLGLSLSNSSVTYGNEQVERISVWVSPEFAGLLPTGTVNVTRSTTTLCVITLSSAIGSCTLSAEQFVPADYDVEGVYSGNTDFGSSGSAKEALSVSTASSSTAMSLSNATVTYGDELIERMSVTVSPEFAALTPTGAVTVKESTATVCVITLSSARGSCALSASRFGAGSVRLVAYYSGSSDFGSSASGGSTFTVAKATSETSLLLSSSKISLGKEQVEHISVTASPEFADSSTSGTVTVTESTSTLCVITLSSDQGSCTLSPSRLAVGTYQLVAHYAGSASFDGSESAAAKLVVVFVLSVG